MKTKTYILTSERFIGECVFSYKNDLLESYDLSGAQLSEEQHVFILKNLPLEVKDLYMLTEKSKAANVKEFSVDFEKFWSVYDDKVLSSKKRAQAKWNKMNSAEQLKAFNYIRKYFASIPSGTRKKMAETYLNAELWNN